MEPHVIQDHNDFGVPPVGIKDLLEMLLKALIVALLVKAHRDLSAGKIKGAHRRLTFATALGAHGQRLASPSAPGVGHRCRVRQGELVFKQNNHIIGGFQEFFLTPV